MPKLPPKFAGTFRVPTKNMSAAIARAQGVLKNRVEMTDMAGRVAAPVPPTSHTPLIIGGVVAAAAAAGGLWYAHHRGMF